MISWMEKWGPCSPIFTLKFVEVFSGMKFRRLRRKFRPKFSLIPPKNKNAAQNFFLENIRSKTIIRLYSHLDVRHCVLFSKWPIGHFRRVILRVDLGLTFAERRQWLKSWSVVQIHAKKVWETIGGGNGSTGEWTTHELAMSFASWTRKAVSFSFTNMMIHKAVHHNQKLRKEKKMPLPWRTTPRLQVTPPLPLFFFFED